MTDKFDFSSPPPGHQVTLKVEAVETPGDAWVRWTKDVALFAFALGVVATLLLVCYQTVSGTVATADEKKWAMSIITALAGGLVGYLVKK